MSRGIASWKTLARIALALGMTVALAAAAGARAGSKQDQLEANERMAKANLATFDTLDYTVFTNQQWQRLHESHSKNVIVHWPDGHTTQGIEKHIEDLKAMFVYAPDTRIKVHTVKIGSGEWTSVIGIMEGTFTEPMPKPGGGFIPPTKQAFKITMCTVGHWKDGVMDEEYLFWDNYTFLQQMGLGG